MRSTYARRLRLWMCHSGIQYSRPSVQYAWPPPPPRLSKVQGGQERYRENTGATITTVRQIERPAGDHHSTVPRRALDGWPRLRARHTGPAGTENQVASGEIRRIEPASDRRPTDRPSGRLLGRTGRNGGTRRGGAQKWKSTMEGRAL